MVPELEHRVDCLKNSLLYFYFDIEPKHRCSVISTIQAPQIDATKSEGYFQASTEKVLIPSIEKTTATNKIVKKDASMQAVP